MPIPKYPKDFLWGVANAAYQVEGHLNGEGQPANNWFSWERKPSFERSGEGCDFWNRFEEDIERASALGINAFRLSLEWARLQPGPGKKLDRQALDRYGDMLGLLYKKKITPLLTLNHFTHPLWLGLDPWLSNKGADGFEDFVARLIPPLNQRLQDKFGAPPISFFITINEPNILAISTYLLRVFPQGPFKMGLPWYHRQMMGLLRGHILAYRKIHSLYSQEGWAEPVVTCNNWACGLYMLDRVFVDILGSKGRMDLKQLRSSYTLWQSQRDKIFSQTGLSAWRARLERWMDSFFCRAFPWTAYQGLLDLKGEDSLLDCLSLDYYDPFLSKYIFNSPHILRFEPWQWDTSPDQLAGFLKAYHHGYSHKKIYLMENGMAYRKKADQEACRPDGKKRGHQLKSHIKQLDGLIEKDFPLGGYCYWSLTDNYEWGSFQPRFGLFGVDYQNQNRRLPTDIAGERVDLIYKKIITQRSLKKN